MFDVKEWDGLSTTGVAVPWKEKYEPSRANEVFTYLNSPQGLADYLEKYRPFVVAINDWTKGARSS